MLGFRQVMCLPVIDELVLMDLEHFSPDDSDCTSSLLTS